MGGTDTAERVDHRRRSALACLGLLTAAAAMGFRMPAFARPSMSLARAAAWYLGGRMSIATNLYFRSPDRDYGKWIGEAKNVSADLGIEIPPLPPRPTVTTDGLLKFLGYFNDDGDGARIKAELARKWGVEHAVLYYIAARLLQLSLVHDIDPKYGVRMAGAIADDCEQVGLPRNLWRPPIEAVAKGEKADTVKGKAVQVYFDVQDFLVKNAGGR